MRLIVPAWNSCSSPAQPAAIEYGRFARTLQVTRGHDFATVRDRATVWIAPPSPKRRWV